MAALYRRDRRWWISFNRNGTQYRHTLNTTSEKVAQKKLKQYEAALVQETFQPPSAPK